MRIWGYGDMGHRVAGGYRATGCGATGTWDRGTRGYGVTGHRDVGRWGCSAIGDTATWGTGDVGYRDTGTWGSGDMGLCGPGTGGHGAAGTQGPIPIQRRWQVPAALGAPRRGWGTPGPPPPATLTLLGEGPRAPGVLASLSPAAAGSPWALWLGGAGGGGPGRAPPSACPPPSGPGRLAGPGWHRLAGPGRGPGAGRSRRGRDGG